MELFVETHVRSEDRQKGVQQFVDNRTQHYMVSLFNHFIL
jgi:Holliday junction resolvase-like predicted endonuclease